MWVTVSQSPSPEGHGCPDPAAGATDLVAQLLSQFPDLCPNLHYDYEDYS